MRHAHRHNPQNFCVSLIWIIENVSRQRELKTSAPAFPGGAWQEDKLLALFAVHHHRLNKELFVCAGGAGCVRIRTAVGALRGAHVIYLWSFKLTDGVIFPKRPPFSATVTK